MQVLIVDDIEQERVFLRALLEHDGCEVLEAASGEQALKLMEYVEEHPIDLVLMDLVMPSIDGIETVRRLRRLHPKHWFPILFLSSQENELTVCQALEIGADDYLVKPVSENLLLAKLHAFARTKALQEELEVMNLELFHSSITDPLTQVHNRLGFLNQYEVQWRISAREQHPISVIMIDVDHFKEFNDNFGHLEGDRCLHAIAQALLEVLKRPGDLLGRFGGEEFIAMLTGTDVRGALRIGEAMRTAICALKIPNADKQKTPWVSISVGVSTCEQVRACHSEDLIRSADDALYAAKGSGRNRVCFIDCRPHEEATPDIKVTTPAPEINQQKAIEQPHTQQPLASPISDEPELKPDT